LLFNFALEYLIRKVQEKQVGLKLNGTHQLLFYDDDKNLLGDNINAIKKNKEALIYASYEVGLQVNTEKTTLKSSIFWDVTPHSPLKINQGFGGTCHTGFLLGLFFTPEDGGDMYF
jgi:hypothetical protein